VRDQNRRKGVVFSQHGFLWGDRYTLGAAGWAVVLSFLEPSTGNGQ
jgi:hypothetical protein